MARIYRIQICYLEGGVRKDVRLSYQATEKTFHAKGERVRRKFFTDNPGMKNAGGYAISGPF